MSVKRPVKSLLFKSTIRAFILWLENEWSQYSDTKLGVALVRNMADLRSYERSTKELIYPFGLMALAQVSVNTERSGYGKRFQSIVTGVNTESHKAQVQHLTPVKVGLGMTFTTDDMNDMINFIQLCVDNAPGPTLVLQANGSGFAFESRVSISPDITVPQADLGSPGKPYMLEVSFVINSWMGMIVEQGLIKSVTATYKEATGPKLKTVSVDIVNGDVKDLSIQKLEYTDLFDTSSKDYRGGSN